jgi:hypothetical protein
MAASADLADAPRLEFASWKLPVIHEPVLPALAWIKGELSVRCELVSAGWSSVLKPHGSGNKRLPLGPCGRAAVFDGLALD